MSTRQFLGGSASIAQKQYYLPGSVSPGAVFTLTLNSRAVSYTATRATLSDVANGLVAAIAASGIAELGTSEMTAAVAAYGAGSAVATPTITSVTDGATGGLLNYNTTYGYRVSAVTSYGETLASTEVTVTTANDSNVTHKATILWGAVTGASSYNVYGRTSSGETLLVNTTAVTWVDDGRLSPSGATGGALPTNDTSNQLVYLLLTAATAGKPFTAPTASVSAGAGGGTPTFTAVTTTGNPTCTTADVTTGGSLVFNTTYYYRVSTVTLAGVAVPNTEFSQTTANDAVSTHQVRITMQPVAGALFYNIYGRSTGAELFLAQVPASVGAVSWSDSGSLTPAGAMPVADTTNPTVTSSGPADWSVANNWSGNTVPIAADDVVIDGYSGDILYNLGQSGITLTSLTITRSFTGRLGLPQINTDNSAAPYQEYRATYLAISATTITIGAGNGAGSPRLKINVGSVATTMTVYATGGGADAAATLPALLWKGTSASNVVIILSGQLGVALLAGETANISGGLTIGNSGTPASDVTFISGSGTTLGTINKYGGTATFRSNITTLIEYQNGTTLVSGNATGGTMTMNAGTLFWESTGAITTLTLGTTTDLQGNTLAATLDTSETAQGFTITNVVQMYAGITVNDPNSLIVMSAGYKLNRCTPKQVALNFGPNRTYTVA